MTTDQIRVRVTVTVTTGGGAYSRRSSQIERLDGGEGTFSRTETWLTDEALAIYRVARREAKGL